MAECRVALVFAGGNALCAYQAGVWQALAEAVIEPERIVGCSAGAMNGAIIAGNPPERRLDQLATLWRPASDTAGDSWLDAYDTWRRTGAVVDTMLGGRPGMFAAAGTAVLGSPPAIYDTAPLGHTLAALVDFDRLNTGPIRYAATAVDLDTGREMVFDTADRRVTLDHIRASGAMPPTFPPVAIDGALHIDGGIAANLPLDPVLAEPGEEPLLCIAVDLLPRWAGRPDTLGDMIGRTQDLIFAAQSRRTLARWQSRYATDPAFAGRSVTLAMLTFDDQQSEIAGKAMDFSPRSVRARWNAGHRDGSALTAAVRSGVAGIGRAGLHLYHPGAAS